MRCFRYVWLVSIANWARQRNHGPDLFLKWSAWLRRDSLSGLGHQKSRLQVDLDLVMPRIQVLTHHDPEDPDQPHFRAAMPPSFELVVDLLPLVGTLHGRSAFVDPVPCLTVSGNAETGADCRGYTCTRTDRRLSPSKAYRTCNPPFS